MFAKPRSFIDNYWMRAMPAERLGTLRVLVGAYALVYLLARTPHLWSYGDLSPTLFGALGVVSILDHPIPPWLHYATIIATLIAALPFVLGWRHRLCAPCFAALLLWVLTYSNCWGQILHTDNLLMLHVIVLALSASADAVSLDAARSAGDKPAASASYGWPIRLLCAITVCVYLLAGIAKLRNSGLDFLGGETLRNYVAFGNVRKIELGSIHSPLGVALLPVPEIFAALAYISFALELGAPLALVHRKLGVTWVAAIWGFHLGVLALMAIAFIYPLTGIAFASFFRVERLPRRWPPWRDQPLSARSRASTAK